MAKPTRRATLQPPSPPVSRAVPPKSTPPPPTTTTDTADNLVTVSGSARHRLLSLLTQLTQPADVGPESGDELPGSLNDRLECAVHQIEDCHKTISVIAEYLGYGV